MEAPHFLEKRQNAKPQIRGRSWPLKRLQSVNYIYVYIYAILFLASNYLQDSINPNLKIEYGMNIYFNFCKF